MSDDHQLAQLPPVELVTPTGPQLGPVELVGLWLGSLPSPRSRRAYAAALRAFALALGVDVGDAVAALLRSRVEGQTLAAGYRARLLQEGKSPSTINLRIAAIRSLVAFSERLGLVSWRLDIPGVKSKKYRDTRGPGRAGFLRLLQAADHPRDRAILWCLFGLALRRGELVSLDMSDLELEAGRMMVRGKGQLEPSPMSIPPRIVDSLRAWIEVRGDQPGPLFLNRSRAHGSARLTDRGVADLLKRLSNRAGVKARPHGLRHSAITAALEESKGNLRAVQRFSRHADPRTILHYDDNREDLGGEMAALVVSTTALLATDNAHFR